MPDRHSPAPPPPIPLKIWKISAVTGASAFMASLDSTVAGLALESIRADFATRLATAQWVVTAYLIALALSLPTAAWLGKRFGYGRVWAWSLTVFLAASAACAFAPGPLELTGLRFLQGLAGGITVPAAQAVLAAVAERKQLGRLMGVVGLVIALGPAIGPAIGGFLIDLASWRWLFWINVPIGLAALVLARGLVQPGERDDHHHFDLVGFLLLGFGLPLLLYGGTETGASGLSIGTLSVMLLGTFLTGCFVVFALREHGEPLIELRLLRNGVFASATATTGFAGVSMYGGLLLIPLYLQIVVEREPSQTGLLMLVMGLGAACAQPVGGALTDRFGAGRVAVAGSGILLISTIPFLIPALTYEAPATALLAAVLFVRGMGLALLQVPPMTAAYGTVSADKMADATTMVNIAQRVGGAIGAIVIVILLTQGEEENGQEAYVLAFGALSVVAFLSVISASFLRHEASPIDEPEAVG